ncbi:MAG: cytidine deaminase [Candidatus Sericytochromatia bacterium]|nr:cytidine deaminase [Candidatus Sericytochromatia bacterium]
MTHEELLALAERAAEHAYCPYSDFRVGAALLTLSGEVFCGCNVENASYGLTICAERTAVGAAVVAGHRQFSAIAIVQGAASSLEPCWPCGACRQVLAEFNLDMTVIFRAPEGLRTMTLRELLPHSFDVTRLQVP